MFDDVHCSKNFAMYADSKRKKGKNKKVKILLLIKKNAHNFFQMFLMKFFAKTFDLILKNISLEVGLLSIRLRFMVLYLQKVDSLDILEIMIVI